jgi:peptidyl-prolyl cis-trans isomerase SurA
MRKVLSITLLIVAMLSMSVGGVAREGRMVDKIAAVVGGEIILFSELMAQATVALKELEKASGGGGAMMVESRRAKIITDTLEQIVDETLITVESRAMKLSVNTEEVDRALANVARENKVDVKTLTEAIKAQGMDLATYRAKLRTQILRFKVLNLRIRGRVKISESEARQYYNGQVRDVRATGTFEGAHLLIRVDSDARASVAASARKKAQSILERAQKGEDFAELAQALSEDKVTAPRGGVLGVLQPGRIPPILDRAFLDLEKGEVAGPIRTPAGFHVIKLIGREMLVQPFSEVKDRIMAQLAQEEMARQEKIWLKELRLRTFIDIRL